MSFKSVEELQVNVSQRIRIVTKSGAIYELSKPDDFLKREIKKSNIVVGSGVLMGIAEKPDKIDLNRSGGTFVGSSPLPDGRVIAFVESIEIGDSLGIMLDGPPTGGMGSTPIVKIEVEE